MKSVFDDLIEPPSPDKLAQRYADRGLVIDALQHALQVKQQEVNLLTEALKWYAAEAEAIAANMQATPPRPDACLASLTILSLDGGGRAAAVFERLDKPSE